MANNAQPALIPAATSRFDGVDILRGLSIIAVILLHGYLRILFTDPASIKPLLHYWAFRILFTNGDNGVTVFFCVSGFLITLTSLRRFGSLRNLRPATFYRIRFARIAPLLLLLLTVLSLMHLANVNGFHINPARATLPRALLAALTFHLNWLEAAHGYLPANWDVMWSLSIEEMFYLFFPLACLLLLRARRGLLFFVLLLLLFVGVGPFARTVWTTNPVWQNNSYLGGMDGIALGCLTALLMNYLQQSCRKPMHQFVLLALQIAGASMMMLILAWPRWHWMRYVGRSGLDGTVLSLGTCLVMIGSVLRGRSGRRWSEPVRWFGRHSYEIYLTHEFVIVGLTEIYLKLHRGSPLIWIAAEVALAAPLGYLVARGFSEPMNRRLRGAAPPAKHILVH